MEELILSVGEERNSFKVQGEYIISLEEKQTVVYGFLDYDTPKRLYYLTIRLSPDKEEHLKGDKYINEELESLKERRREERKSILIIKGEITHKTRNEKDECILHTRTLFDCYSAERIRDLSNNDKGIIYPTIKWVLAFKESEGSKKLV